MLRLAQTLESQLRAAMEQAFPEAAAEAQAAEAARPMRAGQADLADGTTIDFDDFRDADDLMAHLADSRLIDEIR